MSCDYVSPLLSGQCVLSLGSAEEEAKNLVKDKKPVSDGDRKVFFFSFPRNFSILHVMSRRAGRATTNSPAGTRCAYDARDFRSSSASDASVLARTLLFCRSTINIIFFFFDLFVFRFSGVDRLSSGPRPKTDRGLPLPVPA